MKHSRIFTCFLITLIIIFFSAFIASLVFYSIPTRAERIFDEPSGNMGKIEHIYLSAMLLIHNKKLNEPYNENDTARTFIIQLNEPTLSIIQRLHDEGFIKDTESFRLFLTYAGLDKSVQAGEYMLSGRLTPVEIARQLQDATPSEVTFTILAGWRIEEIVAALPTSGLEISQAELLSLAYNPGKLPETSLSLPSGVSLEGYLYPDTYRLERSTSAETFVQTVLANFQSQLDQELLDGFQSQGLDLHQAVTLASIVQREAVLEEEMPMIASVFLNRLSIGMKLDSDPTVQYAIGFNPEQNNWWTNPLSAEDLQYDSLYNTYLYPGLPPGPIANPGASALRSIAFPATTPYYYFRATCDGTGQHNFAATFEEHVANACP